MYAFIFSMANFCSGNHNLRPKLQSKRKALQTHKKSSVLLLHSSLILWRSAICDRIKGNVAFSALFGNNGNALLGVRVHFPIRWPDGKVVCVCVCIQAFLFHHHCTYYLYMTLVACSVSESFVLFAIFLFFFAIVSTVYACIKVFCARADCCNGSVAISYRSNNFLGQSHPAGERKRRPRRDRGASFASKRLRMDFRHSDFLRSRET